EKSLVLGHIDRQKRHVNGGYADNDPRVDRSIGHTQNQQLNSNPEIALMHSFFPLAGNARASMWLWSSLSRSSSFGREYLMIESLLRYPDNGIVRHHRGWPGRDGQCQRLSIGEAEQ